MSTDDDIAMDGSDDDSAKGGSDDDRSGDEELYGGDGVVDLYFSGPNIPLSPEAIKRRLALRAAVKVRDGIRTFDKRSTDLLRRMLARDDTRADQEQAAWYDLWAGMIRVVDRIMEFSKQKLKNTTDDVYETIQDKLTDLKLKKISTIDMNEATAAEFNLKKLYLLRQEANVMNKFRVDMTYLTHTHGNLTQMANNLEDYGLQEDKDRKYKICNPKVDRFCYKMFLPENSLEFVSKKGPVIVGLALEMLKKRATGYTFDYAAKPPRKLFPPRTMRPWDDKSWQQIFDESFDKSLNKASAKLTQTLLGIELREKLKEIESKLKDVNWPSVNGDDDVYLPETPRKDQVDLGADLAGKFREAWQAYENLQMGEEYATQYDDWVEMNRKHTAKKKAKKKRGLQRLTKGGAGGGSDGGGKKPRTSLGAMFSNVRISARPPLLRTPSVFSSRV